MEHQPAPGILSLPLLHIIHDSFSCLSSYERECLALSCKPFRTWAHANGTVKHLRIRPSSLSLLSQGATLNTPLPALEQLSIGLQRGYAADALTSPTTALPSLITHRSKWLSHLPRLRLTLYRALPDDVVQQLAQLLSACPALEQLAVEIDIHESLSGSHYTVSTMHLNLVSHSPGAPMQHHSNLFNNGLGLDALLSSTACRNHLTRLSGTDPDSPDDWLSVPSMATLPALRCLTVKFERDFVPSCMSELTMLTSFDLDARWDSSAEFLDHMSLLTNLVKLRFDGRPSTPIPPSWSHLQSLRQLAVHHSTLPADCPIWQLTSLQQLQIRNCSMSLDFARHLESMVQLTRISLRNQVFNADKALPLSSLTQLLELELRDIESTRLPASLPPSLTRICMEIMDQDADESDDENTKLDVPDCWATSLPNLRSLILHGSYDTIPYDTFMLATLAELTTLEELDLEIVLHGPNTELNHLSSLTRLTSLKLKTRPSAVNPTLNPDLWHQLHAVNRLKVLNIVRMDGWFDVLPTSLTELHVGHTTAAVTSAGLGLCTALRELQLSMLRQYFVAALLKRVVQ